MKIVNKPIFKFNKNDNLIEAIIFCKDFATKNYCEVQLQFQEHTKLVTKETDVKELHNCFFNKVFDKFNY